MEAGWQASGSPNNLDACQDLMYGIAMTGLLAAGWQPIER